MNVLHFSTYDTGGAGIAASRLHQNLRSLGLNSRMIVLNKRNNDESIAELVKHSQTFKIKNIFSRSFLKLRTNQNYYFQSQLCFPLKRILNSFAKEKFKPDIIIAHWISNFLSVENLMEMSQIFGAPVIWYLMDMAPLTGGCHFAWDCLGYTEKCGKCPALYSHRIYDHSYRNLKKKQNCIQLMNIAVVPATQWLYLQAQKASIFKRKTIKKIMLGVDSEIFKPVDFKIAREKLGIPIDERVIFFGSQGSKIKRKGMSYLFDALKILNRKYNFNMDNVMLAIAGGIKEIQSYLDGTIKYKNLGLINNDTTLASAYQAADLFVCPSIEDSGPMMINEAVMCGTPVVSFDMGVAPDLVHTGVTGYRAELRNSDDLARGIKFILEQPAPEFKRMSEQCREFGLRNCHPRIQAQSFKALFNSLLHKNEIGDRDGD